MMDTETVEKSILGIDYARKRLSEMTIGMVESEHRRELAGLSALLHAHSANLSEMLRLEFYNRAAERRRAEEIKRRLARRPWWCRLIAG